jgi:hypothetical protein
MTAHFIIVIVVIIVAAAVVDVTMDIVYICAVLKRLATPSDFHIP